MERKSISDEVKTCTKPGVIAGCGGLSRSTAEAPNTYYTHEANGGEKLE